MGKVAFYLRHGPDQVTINQARDSLELARYAHYKHRDFAKEIIEELRKPRAAMKGETA